MAKDLPLELRVKEALLKGSGDAVALIAEFDAKQAAATTGRVSQTGSLIGRVFTVSEATTTNAAIVASYVKAITDETVREFTEDKLKLASNPDDKNPDANKARESITTLYNEIGEKALNQILSAQDPIQARMQVSRWIQVAAELHNNGNFFAAQSLFNVISKPDIARLYEKEDSFSVLPTAVMTSLKTLTTLYTPDAKGKEALQKCMTQRMATHEGPQFPVTSTYFVLQMAQNEVRANLKDELSALIKANPRDLNAIAGQLEAAKLDGLSELVQSFEGDQLENFLSNLPKQAALAKLEQHSEDNFDGLSSLYRAGTPALTTGKSPLLANQSDAYKLDNDKQISDRAKELRIPRDQSSLTDKDKYHLRQMEIALPGKKDVQSAANSIAHVAAARARMVDVAPPPSQPAQVAAAAGNSDKREHRKKSHSRSSKGSRRERETDRREKERVRLNAGVVKPDREKKSSHTKAGPSHMSRTAAQMFSRVAKDPDSTMTEEARKEVKEALRRPPLGRR